MGFMTRSFGNRLRLERQILFGMREERRDGERKRERESEFEKERVNLRTRE
jgi:hypothetical protein